MKDTFAKIIFFFSDILTIAISIILAYWLRDSIRVFEKVHTIPLENYVTFAPIYIVTLLLFAYEGMYTKRYDFWQETMLLFKALIFSFLIVMAYLAMTKSVQEYSRAVLVIAFLIMAFLVPFFKRLMKFSLHKAGLWCKKALIFGNDEDLQREIFSNPYLGYTPSGADDAKTVFIDAQKIGAERLSDIINKQLQANHEVIFIPLLNDFDLTKSQIYELTNTRTNLISLYNRLKSLYRRVIQQFFNYLLAFLILPILLPIIAIIAILIKRDSQGPVFFAHQRIGKDGRPIHVLKFRSMYVDAKERLEKLLQQDPEIKKEWGRNFKLKNDPRITKIGTFLRKTSLDELPQIFNVFKGEMNFVGPRPVVKEEIEKYYKDNARYYYMVKPGITGLWQVSGRSDTDYEYRVKTDKWYVINWSLWLDIIILFKTFKTVLKKEGAY